MTQTVDTLFINAIVLTMDRNLNQYDPGAVAVKGDSIIAVGSEAEIKSEYTASEIVDCKGRVLMPGLVNAHTHVPMTLMRGLADDLRLDVWLMGYMLPVEREFVSPEFVRLGTQLACAEQIRSGVTTFNDMYFFESDIAQATAEAGMRAVCGQSVMKYPAPDAPAFEDSIAYAREFIKTWKGHPLIVPAIAPHAPYSTTPEILRTCTDIAKEYDVPLHIHISETAFEVENMRNEQGMPVVPYVKKQGLLEAKVIAAHCVHIDVGEMKTLQHVNAGISHNPSSNLKLASGFAPVQKMLDVGLNVGIGTDGPASNNDLDMFEEIRLASFVAKASSNDPTVVPAATALLMGTRLGAQALHIGHLTGSLEAGKRADLIIVDTSPAHNSPRFRRDPHNAYAQLVYASKSTDVTDVMVNGKWLMRDHNLLTLNEADLIKEAQGVAKKIDTFLIEREKSVLSKLIALGGSMQEESFEVQVKVKIAEPDKLVQAMKRPEIEITAQKHYQQFDDYFLFDDPSQGRLRFREDNLIDEKGNSQNVRSRLTLLGQKREGEIGHDVLLSRSRFIAPAIHTARFYREYFKPAKEISITKDRLRWHIRYKNTELFINLDEIKEPPMGHFLEIKSRTWSRKDADLKAELVSELLDLLGAGHAEVVTQDYIEILTAS
ncbi:MAG TPA: amidohydrolase family protein [Anaerolineales bacterium]|nr:amidohydrolase family protein [Anaerolineales bacterium]HMV97281.1 amidohydrolase family protein [Anaerolineales bacterium]HMX72632.1 amidohydrolase family protein [Anaerolineales bacterium]HMZ41623.1 amidohydrolase family protein [Anaerolineales bacterium]HNA52740.1 amidohydrolase family protein [Anaerolineales bacterium]